MQNLLDASIHDLSAEIQGRRLSVLDLTDAHISRIEQINPALSAVVATRFDLARQEALAVEARLTNAPREAPLPPLLGIPFTAQEAVGIAGLPASGGSVYRWDDVAQADSPAVARLRRAGAIPLAATNLSEGGLWIESHNLLYGRTVNPWNSLHTAGGSGGGEAALIASGGSPLGLASGLISSVVLPAAFCGVAAYQPTEDVAPQAAAWGRAHLGCGVLARRCSDLHDVAQILTEQPLSACPADLSGRRVYTMSTLHGTRVSSTMQQAVQDAGDALEQQGAIVGKLPIEMTSTPAIWMAMLLARLPDGTAPLLSDGHPIPVLREALRFPLGRANHTSSALILAVLETLQRSLPQRAPHLLRTGIELRKELESLLGDDGVIVHPPYTRTAPRHRGTLLTPMDGIFAGLFAVMGMPSVVCPMGFSVKGMPLTVQITSRRGGDGLCLDAATHLEASTGGWIRAQPV